MKLQFTKEQIAAALTESNGFWSGAAKKLGCKYGARIPVKKTIFGKSILKNV